MPAGMSLVTGGGGFVGSHVVEALVARGQRVRVLDIADLELPEVAERVEYVRGDIRDPAVVGRACEGVEVVYHTVALVPLAKAGRAFDEVNVGGTKTLLDAALRARVRKVVHVSSSAVYGIPDELPLTEESKIRPLGRYGKAKYAAERLYGEYRQRGLRATVIRPRTVVGARRLGIFHMLFDWIARGKRVWLLGRGSNKLQLISARDLAEACILASEYGKDTVYNVGSSEYGALRDDLQALIDHAGTGARLISVPPSVARLLLRILDRVHLSPLVDWHYLTVDKPFYFTLEKARRELGWQPRDSNVDMLKEAYQWFLLNRGNIERRVGTTHRLALEQGVLKVLRWL